MHNDDPKSIGHCLQGNPLKSIVEKANQITALDKALYHLLPPEVASHCQVMNITNKTLILQADSAAWATRVRYLIPSLLAAFSQQKLPVTLIQCRVRPIAS